MTHIKNLSYGFLVVVVLAIVVSILFKINETHASAPTGLPATVATSSSPTVTSTAVTLVATSSACSARIITTATSSVMLTFSDYAGQTPTAMYGHYQPASTTVAYDSGLYGCGLIKAYSFSTQLVTVTETR